MNAWAGSTVVGSASGSTVGLAVGSIVGSIVGTVLASARDGTDVERKLPANSYRATGLPSTPVLPPQNFSESGTQGKEQSSSARGIEGSLREVPQ